MIIEGMLYSAVRCSVLKTQGAIYLFSSIFSGLPKWYSKLILIFENCNAYFVEPVIK